MHGIRCNAEKERRLTTSEVEFVADSNQAEVRFACCFCKTHFESGAEFTAHIGEHLATAQKYNRNRRSFSYEIQHAGSSVEPQSEAKWVVDRVDVTDVLHKYRNQVLARQSRGQSLSDTDLLALNNIYPFGRDRLESTPVFTAEQHQKIISSIALLQKTTKSSENVRRWCKALSKESKLRRILEERLYSKHPQILQHEMAEYWLNFLVRRGE